MCLQGPLWLLISDLLTLKTSTVIKIAMSPLKSVGDEGANFHSISDPFPHMMFILCS